MLLEQIIHEIAEYEYTLFVVNRNAAGIQQKDGRYITKYFPMSPFVIENMIQQHGSMGCYQQGYKVNRIKWICFDFDCKDKENPNIQGLYEECIKPFITHLNELNIRYLTEFSGRRGIHIWILFDRIFTKEMGFRILVELEKRCSAFNDINGNDKWGLDRFPATDTNRNNIVGKQVKFPLSCHKSGARSYFFCGKLIEKIDTESKQFYEEQLSILKSNQPNNLIDIIERLNIRDSNLTCSPLKYRKYRLIEKLDVSIEQIISILSETVVFDNIFCRMKSGLALTQDWTVLLGTLSLCDSNAKIIKSIFQEFPNYDEKKTLENIDKLRDRYFPATFGYLYRIYELQMENGVDEDETGFHYLLRRLGFEKQILYSFENLNEKKTISDIDITVEKEKRYLKDNDEVPDAAIWNHLCNIKKYDLYFYQKLIDSVLRGEATVFFPSEYRIYERIESAEKTRILISLSAKDRVITTHLALCLCNRLKATWDSYSYHVALTSKEYIFYYWYSSWGRFIDQVHVFLDVPFMEKYEVFYLDLKGFYDHIDFLTMYRTFENELDEEAKFIFLFLIEYNDKLMKEVNGGYRIGVPQGPAYARIIAELFLDKILDTIYGRYDRKRFYAYRYVDDLVFFCAPDFKGKVLFEDLKSTLLSYGLPTNIDKSKYYGSIETLTEDDKSYLLHSDHFCYDLQENEFTGVLFESERKRNVHDYLMGHPFNVGSLGYIFGNKTISDAQELCIERYRKDIFKSREGRGSNFRKFYIFLFRHEKYLERILNTNEFQMIPVDSLNFSNFINVLYFMEQDREISPELFIRIQKEYLHYLDTSRMNENDRTVVNALMMIKPEAQNEKY